MISSRDASTITAIISGVKCKVTLPCGGFDGWPFPPPEDWKLMPIPSVTTATRHTFRNVPHRNGGANRNWRVRLIAGDMASAAEMRTIRATFPGKAQCYHGDTQ